MYRELWSSAKVLSTSNPWAASLAPPSGSSMSLQVTAPASWWRWNKVHQFIFVWWPLKHRWLLQFTEGELTAIACSFVRSSHLLVTVAKASQRKISYRNHTLEHSGGSRAHAAKPPPSGSPNPPALSSGHKSAMMFTIGSWETQCPLPSLRQNRRLCRRKAGVQHKPLFAQIL